MEIVLDTSAYSHLFRQNESLREIVSSAKQVWLPIISIGELYAGFENGRRKSENKAVLDQFLRGSGVDVAHLTKSTAERYAKISGSLRQMGKPIPTNDIWIAAVAMEKGATLVTTDSHFRNIQQIFVQFVEA